jgi:hypothetical protein
MENNKKPAWSGKALRKPSLIAALLLTAISLSACVVPVERDFQGGRSRHHWSNDGDWHGGPSCQGNGGGDWNHHH